MRDSKPWQPPPRPPELKDKHVVDGRSENVDHIDYFALIRETPRPANTSAKHNSNTTNAKNTAKPGGKAPPEMQHDLPEAGLETKIFTHPSIRFLSAQKNKIAFAAAFSFISYASWSIVHSLSSSSREPAAVNHSTTAVDNEKTKPPTTAAAPIGSSKLGVGNAKPMAQPSRNDTPAMNISNSVQHTTEDNRGATSSEAPQFYSSSEAAPPPPETPAEAMTEAVNNYGNGAAQQPSFPQEGYDANGGAVNPPSLTPPPIPPTENGANF